MPPAMQAQPVAQSPQVQALVNALKQRALARTQAAPGVGGAPNTMSQPAMPAPTPNQGRVMAPQPGQPMQNPAAGAVMRAAPAPSPFQVDQGTRAIAKQLVQKLMQHM